MQHHIHKHNHHNQQMEDDGAGHAFIFPSESDILATDADAEEAVILFSSSSYRGETVKVASNCFYEAWLLPAGCEEPDHRRGRCIGVGGNRCIEGEVHEEAWACPTEADLMLRLHWLSPWTKRKLFDHAANVLYRSVFQTSFLAVPSHPGPSAWSCRIDDGFACGVKMSTQLARQNVLSKSALRRVATIEQPSKGWRVLPARVMPLRMVDVEPSRVAQGRVVGQASQGRVAREVSRNPSPEEAAHASTVERVPSQRGCGVGDKWSGRGRRRGSGRGIGANGRRQSQNGDSVGGRGGRVTYTRASPLDDMCGRKRSENRAANANANATADADKRMAPSAGEDVLSFARAGGWFFRTYDLGAIAHHRFDVQAAATVVLCYSEVADFRSAWATSNRRKVRMADALLDGCGSPVGLRGCRYVHAVVREPDAATVVLRVQRAEYPFDWAVGAEGSDGSDGRGGDRLLAACRANMVACCDGNVVDTCWRERVMWTGDLRMAAKALRRLTRNPEVVAHSLHLIADSYDPATAMVQGAWPCGTPAFRLEMPTYHLAFCLTALEHDPSLRFDADVRRVVVDSVGEWRRRHVSADGLLRGLPGWHFVDWCPEREETSARGSGKRDANPAHCVCNVWWVEVCGLLGVDHGIDMRAFDRAFATADGWAMWEGGGGKTNLHATATVLASSAFGRGDTEDLGWRLLRESIEGGAVRRCVTAYYAYFVVAALARRDGQLLHRFVDQFYGAIARAHGTIYEKTEPTASMAHSWSVGFCEFL
jgi:hypothetical protein